MTRLTVIEADNGWHVVDSTSRIIQTFATNAEAWPWLDRQDGSPISRSESVSDWLFHRDAETDT
jgi:hypothetical protein